MAKVRYEGMEIELADEIAQDDAKLRAALVTAWPSISTADIQRTREDGVLVVAAAKRAGSKGGGSRVVKALVAAREHVNAALELAAELKIAEANGSLHAKTLLRLGPRIKRAIDAGERDLREVRAVVDELSHLEAVPSRHVPVGF